MEWNIMEESTDLHKMMTIDQPRLLVYPRILPLQLVLLPLLQKLFGREVGVIFVDGEQHLGYILE